MELQKICKKCGGAKTTVGKKRVQLYCRKCHIEYMHVYYSENAIVEVSRASYDLQMRRMIRMLDVGELNRIEMAEELGVNTVVLYKRISRWKKKEWQSINIFRP